MTVRAAFFPASRRISAAATSLRHASLRSSSCFPAPLSRSLASQAAAATGVALPGGTQHRPEDVPLDLLCQIRAPSEQARPSQVASGADASRILPLELLARLHKNPEALPVSAATAEQLVDSFCDLLQDLHSPVIDVPIPEGSAGEDPRIIVVGDTHGQLYDVLHLFAKHGPPSRSTTYVFNGDIADRGPLAVEIWLLLIAFKLHDPHCVHILRGNHENEQMNDRPLYQGGGFTDECMEKYGSEVREAFRFAFKLLPLFAVCAEEVFVVHGGLFRSPDVNLARLRSLPYESWRRSFPNPLTERELMLGSRWTQDEEILFDAQWSDPHPGNGSAPSNRSSYANLFGEDVTHGFLDEADLSLCIRSHSVPHSGEGYEFLHSGRLLTVFTASNYGRLGNLGAVAVLRQAGPVVGRPPGLSLMDGCVKVAPPLRNIEISIVQHTVHDVFRCRNSDGVLL